MGADILQVIGNFRIWGRPVAAERYGRGHIHETYHILTDEAGHHDYILQKINNRVFKDVRQLMENIATVSHHLLAKNGDQHHKALALVRTRSGETHYFDGSSYWRVFIFIHNSHIYQNIADRHKAREAGRAIGDFQFLLSDLKKPLNIIIPGFHDIQRRLREHKEALEINHLQRRQKAEEEIYFADEHMKEMADFWQSLSSGNIPLRVTHNDTKVNNILFDNDDHAICLIDLDTVMPGYVHFDFGDAIRTTANTAEEDEKDTGKVAINMEIYESFTEGYLETAMKFLETGEYKLLPFSPLYMTFIIGLRFLTDYINGDTYYRTKYADHNLIRAKSQFRLLMSMKDNYKEMEAIVFRKSTG